MRVIDYFKPVETMTAEEVRKFLQGSDSREYNLIDVRQPGEYGDFMEGGVRVSEALMWTKGKSTKEFLELSMSLETASYDLYIKMERTMEEENAKKIFGLLANEEKRHLESLASLLDKKA
jgi:hypothetical protein